MLINRFRTWLLTSYALNILLVPGRLLAREYTVSHWGLGVDSISTLIEGVISVAEISIVPICIAIFIAGAFIFVISPSKEDLRTKGKDLMIGSLIGVGVVYGARGILNMTLYFVYGG